MWELKITVKLKEKTKLLNKNVVSAILIFFYTAKLCILNAFFFDKFLFNNFCPSLKINVLHSLSLCVVIKVYKTRLFCVICFFFVVWAWAKKKIKKWNLNDWQLFVVLVVVDFWSQSISFVFFFLLSLIRNCSRGRGWNRWRWHRLVNPCCCRRRWDLLLLWLICGGRQDGDRIVHSSLGRRRCRCRRWW